MERGLLWLPLLIFIFWLAWSGWNEYQKLEAYQLWSEQFEKAKYDIYAVLGKKGHELTWGKPNRGEPVNLATFSLLNVRSILLLANDQPVNLDDLPSKGKVCLEFVLKDPEKTVQIPFTDISLAAKWQTYLESEWQKLSKPVEG